MDKLRAAARLYCLLGLALVPAAANAAATLTATPTSVAPGGSVTAAWSGIATPTSTDWLGLYTPAAGNTAYLSWRYTSGTASGSVPFTIPTSIASGTYQLRLLANGGYTLLATSSNFTVTATLSGTVTLGGSPFAGVAFAATNGGTCTSSNASGQYSCSVAPGWSGSITPSKSGNLFTPASRSYSNVTAHQTAQNYTATVSFQVSGTVTVGGSPLAGVAIAATNGVTCTSTNSSGQYSCAVPQGWSGSVTPSLSGYTFTPASRNYTNVTAHQTAQNYAAVVFQVSGTVTLGGSPLAGVAFAATNGGSCTPSNASGQYSCTVVTGWSGSVTPTLSGYTFTPPTRGHSNVTTNLTAQDYAATAGGGTAAIFYIHPDHLNTPRVITNQIAQVVWRWDHTEPFGANPPNENPSGLGTFTCNLRLPGQYFDKETNTHYNGARDYDAGIGRYIQSDPIGLRGGINTYAYAYDNPISFFDPDGLQVRLMCRLLDDPLARITARIYGQPQKHCFVYVSCPEEGWAYALSLFGVAPGFNQGQKNIATPLNPARNDDPNSPNLTNDIPIIPQIPGCGTCTYEKDVLARFNRFPNTVPYYGPYLNSNSFANQMIYSPAFGAAVPQGAVANAPGISSSYSIIGIGQ